MQVVRQLILLLSAGVFLFACASPQPAPTKSGYEQVQELASSAIRKGALVIDVRTPDEFSQGHIDGALNISHDQIQDRSGEIPGDRDQVIILYCRTGRRSGIAESILRDKGYTGVINAGGYEGLKKALERDD